MRRLFHTRTSWPQRPGAEAARVSRWGNDPTLDIEGAHVWGRTPPPAYGMFGLAIGQLMNKREIAGSIPGAYPTLGERIAACADPMCW